MLIQECIPFLLFSNVKELPKRKVYAAAAKYPLGFQYSFRKHN
jgi:hypothetical protein